MLNGCNVGRTRDYYGIILLGVDILAIQHNDSAEVLGKEIIFNVFL